MLNRFRAFYCFGLAMGSLAAFGGGCTEDTGNTAIGQFDGPQDVAFICFDKDEEIPLPLHCCKKTKLSEEDMPSCASHVGSAFLYAFVTQTVPGEVAVVDVEAQKIIDQEPRIPYNTFIPVGGHPNDIAASEDGTRVYTVNYETGDLSVIDVVDEKTGRSVISEPFLSPAASIDLGGAAAKMLLVKSESYKDRFALVTQPDLGRLTVVALTREPDSCPNADEDAVGCALGYVSLTEGEDDETPSHPWAITSGNGQSAFVGSYDLPVLWDVQIEALVAQALSLEAFGEIDADDVVNEIIPIKPYSVRSLSIEPSLQRWIYAIESEKRGVIAVNLQDRKPGSGEQAEVVPVSVPGLAGSVAMVELEEDGDSAPLTFNGTFAVVATSLGGFGVIDVADNRPTTTLYHRSHILRSTVDLGDEGDGGAPKIDDEPVLTVDNENVGDNSVEKYLAFQEDAVDGGCDAGDDFKATYDHGIRFRCDPYESKREIWSLSWRGSIGVSGAGVIINIEDDADSGVEDADSDVDDADNGVLGLLSQDENKDFCAQELYTENSVEGYPGDRLVITSKPTPVDDDAKKLCDDVYDEFYNDDDEDDDRELSYRIVGVSRYNEDSRGANVIEFEKEDSSIPDLLPECFGQAVNFEVRASRQWIVKGSRTSYNRTPGTFDETSKTCDYDTDTISKMRMNVGEPFENDYLKFRLEYQEEWPNGPVPLDADETDTDAEEVDAMLQFRVVDGYEQMYSSISASNITDIEFTPDNEVALVDQAGGGLIFFDMLTDFSIIGGSIN
jgi:hypothetical protein